MTGHFKITEHTADVGIRVWGEDPSTVFQTAADGMLSLVVDPSTILDQREARIEISAENPEELLLKWLREILYVMERDRMVFGKSEAAVGDCYGINRADFQMQGSVFGERLNHERHRICTEIKAVTRHGFFLKKGSRGWVANILFDI